MSLKDTVRSDNSAWNRQVYHRLKLALGLGLRRQIFMAVCDDLNLRNQVAARLHSTLAYPVGQVLYQPISIESEASTPAYPRLVTLRLNLNDPNPIAQINQWLTNYPPPVVGGSKDVPGKALPIPSFQMVGTEQLTRQPVAIQRLFLHYLRLTEQHLSSQKDSRFLESSLLLWVPRPWLHAIQQSAPQFWRCRTGVFLFAGEPTPTTQTRSAPRRFSVQRSLDFDSVEEPLIGEQLAIPLGDGDLEFGEDLDFPVLPTLRNSGNSEELQAESFVKEENPLSALEVFVPGMQQEENVQPIRRNSPSNIPNSSDLPHISKELTELILATIGTTIADDPEQNLQVQQILQEIEDLHSQQADEADIGAAYYRLGNIYRIRIEQGQSTLENLMVAILAYQESISYDDSSPVVPDVLNDLGTLYWMLYRTPPNSQEGPAYIEQGIEFYELALKLISPETHSETYARVQNNLGTAYGDLARFNNPDQNWQNAVTAYTEALRFRTAEMEPLKYAACQNNLGTAYWHLAQYSQPVANLKQAAIAYSHALLYYNSDQEPLKYGMIQNNIGTAYWNLAQYEQPTENLQLAIDAYNEALKYRTSANVPTACAATQNNLGTAYWHLANQSDTDKHNKLKYLKMCIEAYDEALALAHSLKGVSLSFDVFATHNNLGLANHQLATDKFFTEDKSIRSQYLEKALENHLQALTGISKDSEAHQSTISYMVKTIRGFHDELGIQGQNLALSKIPGQLLPEILPKL
ncbi:tetratricopeptide repeat protein [Rivularia sp. UHCC 0363]|uniref:tetratricopeptide repeat protein n=1 Tax=Rivularia sp. UHCC 0363 TaxID=3110244 RepID=UPI002B1FB4D3|nr:tetratricopeptide repeat protein [Rivularia sp. UHCC 0363]MEA5596099.1 tetratricopeptide repeat protein [Rivularia sp. UHCC 0363]